MTLATIKLADNYATIQEIEPGKKYKLKRSWNGREAELETSSKAQAMAWWRKLVEAIIALSEANDIRSRVNDKKISQ